MYSVVDTRDTCIVDENVYLPQLPDGFFRHTLHLFRNRYVCGYGDSPVLASGNEPDRFCEHGSITSDAAHIRAIFHQYFRKRPSQSAARAGDQGYLPRYVEYAFFRHGHLLILQDFCCVLPGRHEPAFGSGGPPAVTPLHQE